jgi:hypothetical protein
MHVPAVDHKRDTVFVKAVQKLKRKFSTGSIEHEKFYLFEMTGNLSALVHKTIPVTFSLG